MDILKLHTDIYSNIKLPRYEKILKGKVRNRRDNEKRSFKKRVKKRRKKKK